MAVQEYWVFPSPSVELIQKFPVGSVVVTTPMHMALACCVAESSASLMAELRSASVATPVPKTHTLTVIAPARAVTENNMESTTNFERMVFAPLVSFFENVSRFVLQSDTRHLRPK